MAPVKFDDLPKTAVEVLIDDYQMSGYLLKGKQKTSWGGSVLTTAVDLFPGKDHTRTPAKVTWKLPQPFGIAGVSVDKLEVDKLGKFKLEAVADKAAHNVADLKLEAKSDLVSPAKATLGFTYTGLADTQVKFETKPLDPQDLTLEVTRTVQDAVVGLQWTGASTANLTAPAVGARYASGDFFGSVVVKDAFSNAIVHGYYKANDKLKVAACYEHGGKRSGKASLGFGYAVAPGTLLKAKVQECGTVGATVKHEVTKGFTVFAGGWYSPTQGKHSWGLQLSLE